MAVEPKTRTLKLRNVTVDAAIQPRAAGLDAATVEEYAAAMKGGAKFPPCRVFKSAGNTFWLSRGFHRFAGAERAGLAEIECEVMAGDRKDAVIDAACSNTDHGLKRTNADKRRAVEILLGECPEWSDGKLCEAAGVSPEFVRQLRRQLPTVGSSGTPEKRVGKDGKVRTVTPKPTPKPVDPTPDETTASGPDDEPEPRVVAAPAGLPAGAARQAPTVIIPPSVKDQSPAEGPSEDASPAPPKDSAPVAKKPVAPPAVDEWGIPIQPHAVAAFAAIPKFKELVAAVSTAQRLFNEVANLDGGKFLTLPDVSSYRRGKKLDDGTHADRFVHEGLERAFKQIKAAAPAHTVCPYQYADGPHPADCRCCLGLNWTPPLGDSIPAVCVGRAKAAFGVGGEG